MTPRVAVLAGWEPRFIHDSWAYRRGKGVHGAVRRLQRFMRAATANGTRRAWSLQLDVRNDFMSIDKARLQAIVEGRLDARRERDEQAAWLTRVLLVHDRRALPVRQARAGLPALMHANPWLARFVDVDPTSLAVRRRDRPPAGRVGLLAQYAHGCREFPGDAGADAGRRVR